MLLYLPRFDFVSPCFSLHITYLSSENKHGNGLKNEKQSAQKPIAVKETCRWLYIDNWGAYLKKPGEPIENTIEHNKGSQDTTLTRISRFFFQDRGPLFRIHCCLLQERGSTTHFDTVKSRHDTTRHDTPWYNLVPRVLSTSRLASVVKVKARNETTRHEIARQRKTGCDTIEG